MSGGILDDDSFGGVSRNHSLRRWADFIDFMKAAEKVEFMRAAVEVKRERKQRRRKVREQRRQEKRQLAVELTKGLKRLPDVLVILVVDYLDSAMHWDKFQYSVECIRYIGMCPWCRWHSDCATVALEEECEGVIDLFAPVLSPFYSCGCVFVEW